MLLQSPSIRTFRKAIDSSFLLKFAHVLDLSALPAHESSGT
jgi:hypothetical protein